MNKKKMSLYSLTSSQNRRAVSNLERIHKDPPSSRLDKFDPEKIAEHKRKEKKDRAARNSQLEQYSGESSAANGPRLWRKSKASRKRRWGPMRGLKEDIRGSVRAFY